MKKMILSAILMMGCVAFANAQTTTTAQTIVIAQVGAEDGYTEVAFDDLTDVVKQAIKNIAGDAYDVTKTEFNAEKELTRATLVHKQTKEQKIVIIDKDGNEVNRETVEQKTEETPEQE